MELKERLKNVPLQPGVYIYKDKDGKVIYVGKARILRNRMRSYFQDPRRLETKVRAMMTHVVDFDFIVTGSEVEALILENNLIKSYLPRYNIELRDDKTYPYLKVTADQYPGLFITREKKDQVSRYFGPYTDVTSLRETVRLLTSLFHLRTCKTMRFQNRPCLNRDLGKCLAPCNGSISEQQYRENVEALLRFLEGDSGDLLKQKEAEMKIAAQQLEFEKAAQLRDQIQAIKIIREKHQVNFEEDYNLDVVAMIGNDKQNLVQVFKIRRGKITGKDTFWLKKAINEENAEAMEFFLKQYYADNQDIPPEILLNDVPPDAALLEAWLLQMGKRVRMLQPLRGQKKKMLDLVLNNANLIWQEKQKEDLQNKQILLELSQTLELEVVPERIECFDISHLGGQETVASMVVFTGGKPDPKAYRRFKIKNDQNNDYDSLREAVRRRFQRALKGDQSFLPEPDLLIIDGGPGQAGAVLEALNSLGVEVPIFGLAKKNEELFYPGNGQPLVLPRRHPGLMMLQRLRDEAHRFAITYNRQRRSAKITNSALDSIEGIGQRRKMALLQHFGSTAALAQADVESLAAVPGMNKRAAENIFKHFHES
jgi:excinuclease ABC subunit C